MPQLAFEHFELGQHPGLLSGGDSARGPSERPETGPRPSAAVVSATVTRMGRIWFGAEPENRDVASVDETRRGTIVLHLGGGGPARVLIDSLQSGQDGLLRRS